VNWILPKVKDGEGFKLTFAGNEIMRKFYFNDEIEKATWLEF
jgi:hypothetical protein